MEVRHRQRTFSFFLIFPMWFNQHFQGNAQRKTSPGCRQIKFNKTNRHACVVSLFVCKKKKKLKKKKQFTCSKMRHGDGNIYLMYSLSTKTGLSNIVEGYFFFCLVCGALIVAIIQSFRAKMPVWETAHHPLILLKSQRTDLKKWVYLTFKLTYWDIVGLKL